MTKRNVTGHVVHSEGVLVHIRYRLSISTGVLVFEWHEDKPARVRYCMSLS